MSSTNRGYERHKADYYVTPHEPIHLFIKTFAKDEGISFENLAYLDPCAGGLKLPDDKWPFPAEYMSYPSVLESYGAVVSTWDIRENSLAEFKGDYLLNQLGEDDLFDIIITNPPFDIALDIIKKALDDVANNGYVIMLLRLNFFGSKGRKEFFNNYMPKYCYVHAERMNFITPRQAKAIKVATGKSPSGDSIEYAHFVWQKGYHPEFCLTKII